MNDDVLEKWFKDNLEEHGCGYYSVCLEKECACSLNTHVELDEKVWNRLAMNCDDSGMW